MAHIHRGSKSTVNETERHTQRTRLKVNEQYRIWENTNCSQITSENRWKRKRKRETELEGNEERTEWTKRRMNAMEIGAEWLQHTSLSQPAHATMCVIYWFWYFSGVCVLYVRIRIEWCVRSCACVCVRERQSVRERTVFYIQLHIWRVIHTIPTIHAWYAQYHSFLAFFYSPHACYDFVAYATLVLYAHKLVGMYWFWYVARDAFVLNCRISVTHTKLLLSGYLCMCAIFLLSVICNIYHFTFTESNFFFALEDFSLN